MLPSTLREDMPLNSIYKVGMMATTKCSTMEKAAISLWNNKI